MIKAPVIPGNRKPTTLAGGVRRKPPKKNTNSKLNLITLEKNIAPYQAGLISNVNAVRFYADDREKQLQFNFPKVKTAEKVRLMIVYSKAVQMPEPPDDIMLKEMENSKKEAQYDRKPNKLERRLSGALTDKLPLKTEYDHISLVSVKVGKTDYKVSAPKIQKIIGEDIYLVWGIIERVNDNIIHSGNLPSLDAINENGNNGIDMGNNTENKVANDVENDENNIQLVMDQTGLSKQEAQTLLTKNNGDLMEAIMSFENESD